MKRFGCLALALVLALALAVPASAAEFSDLPTTSEFYDYMMDLYNRGIFTGYNDGTIRPDKTTTIAQALTVFSRLYDLSDADKALIYEDYGDRVRAVVPTDTAQVYINALSVCMAADIITERELAAYPSIHDDITREDLAVYLVRTMQLEETAHEREYASLKFTDSETISSDALFHIDLLASLGIIGGYTDGSFRPNASSTRKAVAKFISRSLDYLEKNQISLTIEGYHNTARYEGVLTAFDGETVTVMGMDGLARCFTRTSASGITVNGATAALTQAHLGSRVTVTAQGNALTAAALTVNEKTDFVRGEVAYLATAAATGDYIAVFQAGTKTEPCTVTQSTVYVGATGYDALEEGQYVVVERTDAVAAKVYVSEGTKTLSGTVTTLRYAIEGCTLRVTDSAGAVWSFTIAYDSIPKVEVGGVAGSLSAIAVGDAVTLTVDGATLTAIARRSEVAEYSGKLTYIGRSSTRTDWTLTDASGATVTLPLSPAASVENATGGTIAVSTVSLGDTLTVTTADGVITKLVRTAQVSVSGQTAATTSVEGTVLYVDTGAQTIFALVDGGLLTLSTSGARLQNTTGASVMLRVVASGQTFLAYGSYSDTAAFAPTLVIFN